MTEAGIDSATTMQSLQEMLVKICDFKAGGLNSKCWPIPRGRSPNGWRNKIINWIVASHYGSTTTDQHWERENEAHQPGAVSGGACVVVLSSGSIDEHPSKISSKQGEHMSNCPLQVPIVV